MTENFYNSNRQKLLFMVRELHRQGYGKLHVVPSLAPSGMAWRCSFIDDLKLEECIASNWISHLEPNGPVDEIELSAKELADLFLQENKEFARFCRGTNKRYERWYDRMVEQLEENELPYAFADYQPVADFWRTSKEKEIKTLPNEKEYYI